MTSNIIVTGSVDTAIIGEYILSYNVSDNSTNAATEVTRTVNVIGTLSIDKNDINSVYLYPNPVYDTFYINGWKEDMSLSIYDVTGKMIYSGKDNQINMNNITPLKGVYFVKVQTKNQSMTFKIIKS